MGAAAEGPGPASTSGQQPRFSIAAMKLSLQKYGRTGVAVYLGISFCVTTSACGLRRGRGPRARARAARCATAAAFCSPHAHPPPTAAAQAATSQSRTTWT